MKEFIEGSAAIARAIKLCRPGVISAYPITPQTHIGENLAQYIADGEMDCEFVNSESEHSSASIILGVSSVGVRSVYVIITFKVVCIHFQYPPLKALL